MRNNLVYFSIASILLLSASPVFAYGVQTKTTNCTANQTLPDLACTPGAVLTTSTSAICVSGYTQTVRNVTTATKKKVFKEYGIPWSLHSNYEVDHLISLEIGGSNDISNLWPESYNIKNSSLVKDQFENYLHKEVCKGLLTLPEAQREISGNWLLYYGQWKYPSSTTATTSVQQTSHTFYLSTYSASKFYYCDSDSAWRSLSTKYLKSYPSEAVLLADYPSKTLHEVCK